MVDICTDNIHPCNNVPAILKHRRIAENQRHHPSYWHLEMSKEDFSKAFRIDIMLTL